MTPHPAERTFLIWSGRKKTSVALLGTRSTVDPKAYSGLNLFTAWPAAASTVTVCAGECRPHRRTAVKIKAARSLSDAVIATLHTNPANTTQESYNRSRQSRYDRDSVFSYHETPVHKCIAAEFCLV